MSDNEQYRALVGGVFSYQMPVRWGDMDALGHVNNTVYFRFFEEARVVLLQRIGMMFNARYGWVLAHASCDFLKPLLYPADVVVTSRVLRVGRSSLELEVSMARTDDLDSVIAKGCNVMVHVDQETGRSAAFPSDMHERLGACFVMPSAVVQSGAADRD